MNRLFLDWFIVVVLILLEIICFRFVFFFVICSKGKNWLVWFGEGCGFKYFVYEFFESFVVIRKFIVWGIKGIVLENVFFCWFVYRVRFLGRILNIVDLISKIVIKVYIG